MMIWLCFSGSFLTGLFLLKLLVNEMEFKKLTDQYSFHTEKALSYILKTGVENVQAGTAD